MRSNSLSNRANRITSQDIARCAREAAIMRGSGMTPRMEWPDSEDTPLYRSQAEGFDRLARKLARISGLPLRSECFACDGSGSRFNHGCCECLSTGQLPPLRKRARA